jgi:hypothetical protein
MIRLNRSAHSCILRNKPGRFQTNHPNTCDNTENTDIRVAMMTTINVHLKILLETLFVFSWSSLIILETLFVSSRSAFVIRETLFVSSWSALINREALLISSWSALAIRDTLFVSSWSSLSCS